MAHGLDPDPDPGTREAETDDGSAVGGRRRSGRGGSSGNRKGPGSCLSARHARTMAGRPQLEATSQGPSNVAGSRNEEIRSVSDLVEERAQGAYVPCT